MEEHQSGDEKSRAEIQAEQVKKLDKALRTAMSAVKLPGPRPPGKPQRRRTKSR